MRSAIHATKRLRGAALGAIAASAALAAAACGSSSSQAGSPASTPSHHAMTHHKKHHMTDRMTHTAAMIGSDCGMIPATGMGSAHSMTMEPVLTAAGHNPLLTTFAADAKRAGLTADLSSMHSFTYSPRPTAPSPSCRPTR
jgi:hypothetical protein